jgi:putative inorganic carbon (hco3(-)) transporter
VKLEAGPRSSRLSSERTGERISWLPAVAAGAITAVTVVAVASTHQPGRLAFAALGGIVVLAAALAAPRVVFAGILFALAGYLPDVLLKNGTVGPALLAVTAGAVVLRATVGVESWPVPREMWWLGAFGCALVLSSAGAADAGAATSRIVDFVGFALLVALMLLLVDSETALRRAMWCVAGAIGFLAVLALVQRAAHLNATAFGGLATVVRDGSILRSGGPLSANFFGEILAPSAMLGVYLALDARSKRARAVAIGISVACVGALFETGSRGAFLAIVAAAALCMLLRRVRLVTWVAIVVAAVIAIGLLLPAGTRARLSALGGTLSTSSIQQNGSFRGRLSENLAALDMWRAHPLTGVGPGNFETHYLSYAPARNLDQRAEVRSAHSLYLESLAETGLLGAIAFFGLIAFALRRAWRGRRSGNGRLGLLAEGAIVALFAFLVAALTLHQAYPRFLWLFLGLTLAAGRTARETRQAIA